jgi:putative hemin transport protein
MALTRNRWCVHERRGAWSEPELTPHVGTVVGPDIDLRIFPRHWAHVVATVVDNARGPLPSIQVFDARGEAVHKVFCTPATDRAAWGDLVEALRDPAPGPLRVEAPTPVVSDREDADIDADGLRGAWAELRDTHDFFPMLRTFAVGRRQALRLAGRPWARPVDRVAAVENALRGAAATGQAIMVFVGNPGCIQIHTGPVRTVAWRGPWLNVLDPDFDLHLDTDGIADAWVVEKPTVDGPVRSLELYAAGGELIAQLFGARKPGKPEDPAWSALVAGLA